jgi:hypothetical protein
MDALLQFIAGCGIFGCGWFVGSSYGFVRGVTQYKKFLAHQDNSVEDIDEENL